jgi:Tfp pilus assembly protein PilV
MARSRERQRGNGGFSFLEVMVAMFFLSFIVGEMAMISISATRTGTLALRLSRANMIGEAVLETSRNTAFEKLDTEWFADADGNGAWTAGEPRETKTVTGTRSDFSWDYDLPNGTRIAPVFTRVRSVEFFKYANAGATPPHAAATATTATWADVTVTVEWRDARGRAQQAQVKSRISKF